jgi:hypothetical protein
MSILICELMAVEVHVNGANVNEFEVQSFAY